MLLAGGVEKGSPCGFEDVRLGRGTLERAASTSPFSFVENTAERVRWANERACAIEQVESTQGIDSAGQHGHGLEVVIQIY